MKQLCEKLFGVVFMVFMISVAAIDSDSELPFMIMLICLLLMGLFAYLGELWVYDEDDE